MDLLNIMPLWLWIVLIIFILIVMISSIFIIIYYKQIKNFIIKITSPKDYYKVYFIYPNNQIEWQPLKPDVNNQFTYKERTFNLNENCVKYENKTPVLYYLINIPYAIDFKSIEFENASLPSISIDASTYRVFNRNKLIKDLASDSKQTTLILIILIGIAIAILFLILYQTGMLDEVFKGSGLGGK